MKRKLALECILRHWLYLQHWILLKYDAEKVFLRQQFAMIERFVFDMRRGVSSFQAWTNP
jgi:hypothetical protein